MRAATGLGLALCGLAALGALPADAGRARSDRVRSDGRRERPGRTGSHEWRHRSHRHPRAWQRVARVVAGRGRLLYISGAGFADSDLYVYSLRTGRSRRLTAHAGLDAFPAWSPDGSRIAWTASRGGRLAIWVMSSDGSHKRQLTHGSTAEDPSWSPDGRTIAFIEMPRARSRSCAPTAAGDAGSRRCARPAVWQRLPGRPMAPGSRSPARTARCTPSADGRRAAPPDPAASLHDRMATGLVAVRTRDRVRQPGTR